MTMVISSVIMFGLTPFLISKTILFFLHAESFYVFRNLHISSGGQRGIQVCMMESLLKVVDSLLLLLAPGKEGSKYFFL